MEETKWLTKGKIIIISLVVVAILSIFIGVSIHKSNLRKKYIEFENQLAYAGSNYLLKEKIELKENEWRQIDIKDIIKQKLVTFSRASDCKGYVIVQSSSTTKSIDSSNNSYSAYISCGKIYKTKNYGYKPSGMNQNNDKTQTQQDTEKPNIELFGDKEITLTVGDKYKELGAVATDNVDGDITSKIKISGKVNTKVAGEYLVKYTVSDSSKNKTSVERKVIVKEKEQPTQENKDDSKQNNAVPEVTPTPTPTPTPSIDRTNPIITFNNNSLYQTICAGNSVNISINGPYGYIARDNVDGDITSRVIITGDTGVINNPGIYTLNYKVSDSAGNTSYATKNFTVKSCVSSIPKPNTTVLVSGLSITPNNKVMSVNSTYQLSVTINPSNATNKSVTFSSSNTSVAQVNSNGFVTAKQPGTATIIATSSNGKRATCIINVR